jgi:energy-coupling factor transporter ATP-binding protein EcfA2
MYKSAVQEEEIALEQRRGYSVVGSSPAEMEMFNFAAKRIDRIEISNLRGIPRLDFTFPAMGECESWIMLIGENGVGKTTILQGVALALMGEERANKYGLNAAEFTRRGEREGFVRVHINAIGSVELRFNRTSKRFTVDPADPKVPLLAYGPTRLLPSDTEKKPLTDRNIRTDNLFKPTVPLSDAEIWLAATSKDEPETFHNVGQALCRLLMISEKSPPRARDGKVEIRMADGWRRISELSSGYRSVLALVVDIAIGTSGKRRKAEEAVGIVLLDEIEIHLHPIWKISIVERLRNVFPQLSFLVTTHDPLCLKGLQDREIVALRRDESGLITFAADMPSVNSLNADDILTSNELFELPSSRNSASPVTIARYSALLNVSALSEEQKRELKRLQEIISQMFSGALIPMQREVERAVTIVLKHIREGKEGRELTKDAVAEIRRQVLDLGRQS